jgi:hypothetical protein
VPATGCPVAPSIFSCAVFAPPVHTLFEASTATVRVLLPLTRA